MPFDSDRIEAFFLEKTEMLRLKARRLTRTPDRVVARDVHAAAQSLILGKGVGSLARERMRAGPRPGEQGKNQRRPGARASEGTSAGPESLQEYPIDGWGNGC